MNQDENIGTLVTNISNETLNMDLKHRRFEKWMKIY